MFPVATRPTSVFVSSIVLDVEFPMLTISSRSRCSKTLILLTFDAKSVSKTPTLDAFDAKSVSKTLTLEAFDARSVSSATPVSVVPSPK